MAFLAVNGDAGVSYEGIPIVIATPSKVAGTDQSGARSIYLRHEPVPIVSRAATSFAGAGERVE